MGFFSGMTDALFKEGPNGENLFFPNGCMGSGYVLKNNAHKTKIQYSMKKWIMAMFAIIIINSVFVKWIAYPLIAIHFIWYFFWIKEVTKELPKSSVTLKYSESLYLSAKSTNLVYLILLEILALGVVTASIVILLKGKEILIPLLIIGFFGVGVVTFGYQIYLKCLRKK